MPSLSGVPRLQVPARAQLRRRAPIFLARCARGRSWPPRGGAWTANYAITTKFRRCCSKFLPRFARGGLHRGRADEAVASWTRAASCSACGIDFEAHIVVDLRPTHGRARARRARAAARGNDVSPRATDVDHVIGGPEDAFDDMGAPMRINSSPLVCEGLCSGPRGCGARGDDVTRRAADHRRPGGWPRRRPEPHQRRRRQAHDEFVAVVGRGVHVGARQPTTTTGTRRRRARQGRGAAPGVAVGRGRYATAFRRAGSPGKAPAGQPIPTRKRCA